MTVQGAGREPVIVDLLRDRQTVLTQTVELEAGQGKLQFDLPPEIGGAVELVATDSAPEAFRCGSQRPSLSASPKEWSSPPPSTGKSTGPASGRRLRFKLTDAQGRPKPDAVILAVVDEAVFAVTPERPGMEAEFLAREEELRYCQ